MTRSLQEPFKARIAPGHAFFDLVEQAYRIFDYPTPVSTDVCQWCCMEPEIEADFFNPPIRALPLHYVQDWFFAACNPTGIAKATWGYLLPRILEILAADEEISFVGREVSLNRFETGNPRMWSEEEWSVLDGFQHAYLAREIRRTDEYLDATICMFGVAGWSLESLLGQVSAASDAELAERFWNDWCARRTPGREGVWIDTFWDQSTKPAYWGKAAKNALSGFYTSRQLYERMAGLALAGDTQPDLAAHASAVAAVIKANAAWKV